MGLGSELGRFLAGQLLIQRPQFFHQIHQRTMENRRRILVGNIALGARQIFLQLRAA